MRAARVRRGAAKAGSGLVKQQDFYADLEARGLVHQATSEELPGILRAGAMTAYIGFDPSADSLHVGSLLQVLGLMRFQRAGHHPIAVVGGGTGMIGDPSGKSAERNLLTPELLEANLAGQRRQLERFLDFTGPRAARLVNNLDWLAKLDLIGFLRDIGKHFSVNAMIQRDSVQLRIAARDQGISYTEFSYALLQAYDFLELYDRFGCRLQMGGSDQWGNITDGCDLIRRLRQGVAHGLTMPLITKSDGSKFGKTEAGTVWLDSKRTSEFAFYQYWLNTPDADAGRYLHYFTFLDPREVADITKKHAATPERRAAQRLLAEHVTRLVHGDAALARAQRASAVLFEGGDLRTLSPAEIGEGLGDAPRTAVRLAELQGDGLDLPGALVRCGLAPSKGQARTSIEAGAVSVNHEVVKDATRRLTERDLLADRFVVLRRGKKTYSLIDVAG
jgi:tyrosyl-tRNA synthetase